MPDDLKQRIKLTVEDVPSRYVAMQWDGTAEGADWIAKELTDMLLPGKPAILHAIDASNELTLLNLPGAGSINPTMNEGDWILGSLSDGTLLITHIVLDWMMKNYRVVEGDK